MLESDWYSARLRVKQARDIELWKRHVNSLIEFLALPGHKDEAERLDIAGRLERARAELDHVSSDAYLSELYGTIGADPIHRALAPRRAVARPRFEGARTFAEGASS
jgi:hypothetical protein